MSTLELLLVAWRGGHLTNREMLDTLTVEIMQAALELRIAQRGLEEVVRQITTENVSIGTQ